MDIIFKGFEEDIERFVNEVIYPVVFERQRETDGHYFRFTDNKGEYYSRDPECKIKVRRMRGYFPDSYHKGDDEEFSTTRGKKKKTDEDSGNV